MANGPARQDEKKSGGGFMGVLVATLLALSGGGAFGYVLSGDLKPAPGAADKKVAAATPKVSLPAASRLIELSPIVVNMGEPRTTWLRVQASVLIDREYDEAPELAAKIGEDILAYLRTTSVTALEGGSGLQAMREDINERARLRGGDKVREVVIQGLVAE